jgi:hypothetical protein
MPPKAGNRVVVLPEPIGTWPRGTAGAVISVYDDTLLVEVTGPGGKTVDTLQALARQLEAKRP